MVTVLVNSAITLAADLGNHKALKTLVEQAAIQWSRIDVLINNASSFYPTPVAEAKPDDWQDLFDSNTKGAFFLSQYCLQYLQKTQGCIVNIVDIHGAKPLKNHSIYSMAKAALGMMTQALAKDLAPVRVNGIAPGAILWPEQNGEISLDPQQQQEILSRVPLARPGDPEDIVKTALFLITQAPYITGQIINVDGGRSLNL